MPQEVNKVSLFKDPIYEDFGFSVSDGLYERGIYINRIRKGGPADESSLLKPFDRILQINQVHAATATISTYNPVKITLVKRY